MYRILMLLDRGEGLSIAHLAALLKMKKELVLAMIGFLEERGYLDSSPASEGDAACQCSRNCCRNCPSSKGERSALTGKVWRLSPGGRTALKQYSSSASAEGMKKGLPGSG